MALNLIKGWFVVIATFGVMHCGHAGSVRLLNGERVSGDMRLGAGGLEVIPSGESVVKIKLADILFAEFAERDAGKIKPGMMLLNRTVLPGKLGNKGEFKLSGGKKKDDPPVFEPADNMIAGYIFSEIEPEDFSKMSGQGTGVLLPNGDFFPGEVGSQKGAYVVVNSLMFGPQRFKIKELKALIIRPYVDVRVDFTVQTKSGARFSANGIKSQGDSVVFKDRALGEITLESDMLVAIDAGPSRFQLLTELAPQLIQPEGEGAAEAVVAEGIEVPSVDEATIDPKRLVTKGGYAVSYGIPKGMNAFVCKVRITEGSKPVPASFAVYADGKFVARTQPMTLEATPQILIARFSNASQLNIRLEIAGAELVNEVSGDWIEPMFVRR